jgi:hypothetical protein
MKRSERSYRWDLQRLVQATALYARQQWERLAVGGEEEYDEVTRENRQVVQKVLPVIEQMLDEDLIEQLDQGGAPGFSNPFPLPMPMNLPTPWSWPMAPCAAPWGGFSRRRTSGPSGELRFSVRPTGETRTTVLLDQILNDFRADVLDRFRKARREDRAIDDAELDDLVKGLREELNLVAKRSRQRRERVGEDDASK